MKIQRAFWNWAVKRLMGVHFIDGDASRLHLGEGVRLVNTVINLASGRVEIGSHTIFSYNVMILTGIHQFIAGKRGYLSSGLITESGAGASIEVPDSGRDVVIGEGCWIGGGAIILGGSSIGAHSIVAAGAVVTKRFPEHSVLAGVPARRIGDTRTRN